MRKVVSLSAALALVMVQVSACSTHKGFVNYSEFKKEMPVKTGAFDGEVIGQATGSAGGAVWDDCKKKSADAVRDLIGNAKSMGANAVGNVKWAAGEGTKDVQCRKNWGFVLLWPFLLTPLFMSTSVTGDAYKLKGGSKSAGLYKIPANPAEEAALVDELAADL